MVKPGYNYSLSKVVNSSCMICLKQNLPRPIAGSWKPSGIHYMWILNKYFKLYFKYNLTQV